MAAKGWTKNANTKFQPNYLNAGKFGQFSSAGPTGPLSSESRKNPAESRVVTLVQSFFLGYIMLMRTKLLL
jgi:hypothetical protein